MKLLFDQNLSPRLATRLSGTFPGTTHVALLGLGEADDGAIWTYAHTHGFVIVTKDADFNEMSLVRGTPPQVVWIRRGNCSVDDIEAMLTAHAVQLEALLEETSVRVLVLY